MAGSRAERLDRAVRPRERPRGRDTATTSRLHPSAPLAAGWHVHIHALLCFGRDIPVELVRETVGALAFGRWCRALERHGFDASEEHG